MNRMQILKSKRGVAIENAVLFLLVIFLICALLTSLAVVGHYKVNIDNMVLLRDVEIEQIGDDFLASITAKQNFTQEYDNFAYSVAKVDKDAEDEADTLTLTVWYKSDESKNVVLYVEVDAELALAGQVKVIKWLYSLPTQTE